MDFRELNYILAIAKHQNITKAADSLYVGQPTLSKFLITLEDELGLKLFRKVGHKYMLTYAGERYVERANQILQIKSDLDAELADIIKRDVGVLNVAFANMRGIYMLPRTLPAFQDRYPHVKVNIFEGSSDENDRRLLDGQVEVAFYSKPSVINPQIEYENLMEEELLICTCRNHPIGRYAVYNPYSKYPKLDVNLLKDERVVMMKPEHRTRQIMDTYLQDHNIQLENVIYTGSLPAIMELVSMGYGISFIFETHLRYKVKNLPMDCYSFGNPKVTSDFVAAFRKGSYVSNYTRDFVEIVRSAVFSNAEKN